MRLVFRFWKKKEEEKKDFLEGLPPLESGEKDKIEVLHLKIEKLDLRLQNLIERLDKIEKMVEEIYRLAKS